MRCGFYENDITPPLGVNLPGYFVARSASGARDALCAKAMAMTDDAGRAFVLISMDTIAVDAPMAAAVRARVGASTGLAPESIMLAATHTHTGGPVDNFVPGTRDASYVDWLCTRAADAGILAFRAQTEARMGAGAAHEDAIAFVRRYYMKDGSFATNPGYRPDEIDRPAGRIDPEVGVVKIEHADGRLMGVITNYACHLDTVGGDRYCADYPGALSRAIKSVYGPDVVSLFLTGACGNINHHDFMNKTAQYYKQANPPHYVRMGRALAGGVIRALALIETRPDISVDARLDSFRGQVRRPAPEDIAAAEALLSEHPYQIIVADGRTEGAGNQMLVRQHYAQALLAVAKADERAIDVPVQVIRMGEAAIVGLPCELFVEFGLDIKARSGLEHVLISTLTNAHIGYVSVREAFEQGGYETMISGDTKMGPDTGYDMADLAVRLIRGEGV